MEGIGVNQNKQDNDQVVFSWDLDYYVEHYALKQAKAAVQESSYGVGGVMINLQTLEIIHELHNTVIAQERLKDPTAHGERQLVDWYFAHKEEQGLPEPNDILVITTLDPCCMCTGSLLSAGFKVIIAAMDSQAGINYNNECLFEPFEGKELKQIQNSFIYPMVRGDNTRKPYGDVPAFNQKTLSAAIVQACLDTFNEGAKKARGIIGSGIPRDQLKDIQNLPLSSPIIAALKEEYPHALEYRTRKPDSPDEGLAKFLIEASKEDKRYGGDGDAVAFLDCFGNLLMCKAGRKSLSPIRTAYMETIRAYQKVRYTLCQKENETLQYLCDPKFGTFVFVKGFDKGTQSFADLGAYGSTILGTLENQNNLQYVSPRIGHSDLLAYIGKMPPRYKDLIHPKRIENQKLITLVENSLLEK